MALKPGDSSLFEADQSRRRSVPVVSLADLESQRRLPRVKARLERVRRIVDSRIHR